jgi:hypothetical protein
MKFIFIVILLFSIKFIYSFQTENESEYEELAEEAITIKRVKFELF